MQRHLSDPRALLRRGAGAAITGLALWFAAAAGVPAQSLFAPAITVNDDVITNYELQQRTEFLRLLRAPGDPAEQARAALIDDRLKEQAVAQIELEVTEEQLAQGMEEFAARANLGTDEFIQALEGAGVSAETFRDFVRVGVAWREYIRARFLDRVRPNDKEIDRALGNVDTARGVRVLLSEIIIPVTPQTLQAVQIEAERLSRIRSIDAFSAEAGRFSAASTRERGGRMDWLPLAQLPLQIRPLILSLTPGEVTPPIPLPNAVALFQLRAVDETAAPPPEYAEIEYAAYYIPGGRSEEALAEAGRIKAGVDTCNDLYGVAKGQPEERLVRRSVAPSEIPAGVALELAKLDIGEISTTLTGADGQTLMLLMLCKRVAAPNAEASREDAATALLQQRLAALSEAHLDQLRANAVIVER